MNSSFTTWTSNRASIRTTLRDCNGKSGVIAVVQISTDDSEIAIHFETAKRFMAFCKQFNISYTDNRKEKEPTHVQCETGSDMPAGLEAQQVAQVSDANN